MVGDIPKVFVSSTFYDLRHVRDEIGRFLNSELGYEALISEWVSFPVDPSIDAVNNCKRRVKENADLFVLIIGSRYGDERGSTKSVTNREYLTARAKGIPIYAFVQKETLAHLRMWEGNKEADFSHVVDNAKLFDFIQEVQLVGWTHGFENASDIIVALRTQFARLMGRGLKLVAAVDRADELTSEDIARLSGDALQIVLEKPRSWEHRLLAQAMTDEIRKHSHLRQTEERNLAPGPGEDVTPDRIIGWLQGRFADLKRSFGAVGTLFNEVIPEALGPSGVSGDVRKVLSAARSVGDIYCDLLEWSQRLGRVTTPFEECATLVQEMRPMVRKTLREMDELGPRILREIQAAYESQIAGRPTIVDIQITIGLDNVKAMTARLDEVITVVGAKMIRPGEAFWS